ncbi:MAG: GTP cyclohydrolase II [Bacteroidetes bacterium]|nr:GTP cyclohydrolase II [Bacteroidota bacterium]
MEKQAETVLPTRWGEFRIIAYADLESESMPHIALTTKDLDISQIVPVRIHSECMTGDLFGSKRCDCGEQLDKSLKIIAEKGGLLIYLRQEGRGIGLINKLKAYNLQDGGLNTVDANIHLGFEIDSRQYDQAVKILQDIGIQRIHLITNNPDKIDALEGSPVKVISRIPIVIKPQRENKKYLKTKKEMMGHLLKDEQ